jgi:hypothetical protein
LTIKLEMIEKARQVDLVEYCEYKEFEMKDEGNGNYRLIGYDGLIIKDNYYHQFGTGKKGNAIDFCTKILGMKFKDAVDELLTFDKEKDKDKEEPHLAVWAGLKRKNEVDSEGYIESKEFILPTPNHNNKRVFAYLTKTRGLPTVLVNEMLNKNLIYQDEEYGNCIFPCYDEVGIPKGAIVRGTLTENPFKGRYKNSNVEYGWSVIPEKPSINLFVFESPIDALSIMTFCAEHKIREEYILALGGLHIGGIDRFLLTYPSVERICLCLDNDEAATKMFDKIMANYYGDKYEIEDCRPIEKDWNEELLIAQLEQLI